ncbi:MAG: redoxin family protein [Clostridia bacterium]|nr:redoxin family protein [Clostridia bacterium]
MKRMLAAAMIILLIFSLGCASALTVPLKGNGTDGSEKEIAVPDNCRLILVNVWQPWCVYCREEMPALTALHEKYRDQGLTVVGLYSDTDVSAQTGGMTPAEILDSLQVTYPNLRITDTEMAQLAQSFPTVYFADREGNILPVTYDEKLTLVACSVEEQMRYMLESGSVDKGSEDYFLVTVLAGNEAVQRTMAADLLNGEYAYETETEGVIGAMPASGWDRIIGERLKDDVSAETTAVPAEAEKEEPGYTVTVTDEDGNPVAGAAVQICPGAMCIRRKSNEDGKVYFGDVTPGVHEFHLLDIPDGYETASDVPEKTGPDERSILIVLKRID